MMYIVKQEKLSFGLVDWENILEFKTQCFGKGSFKDRSLESDTTSFPKGVEFRG